MGLRKTPWIAVGVIAMFSNVPSLAALQVPKGFESLAEGQIIWLEVSLYGQALGLYQAKVDLETVRFIKPERLADAIRDKYNGSPTLHAMLISTLRVPLPRNSNLSCSTNGMAPGCDYVDTNDASIIYDENNSRVSLFLEKQFLPQRKETGQFYQVTSESKNALVHQQNINFVADREYQSASVQGNGSLGVTKEGYVNVDWNWQGQRYRQAEYQQVDVNNAYFRQDMGKRVYLQGGIMDSRDIFSNAGGNINLSQLPLDKIYGVRAGSTLAWVNPEKTAKGTPVSVFLSRDARVDAYRGDQLLSTFYLKAGAQELDTRSFPPGSYSVTLRVYEDNRWVRSQTTTYTGTGSAAANTFQWFLQGGTLASGDGHNQHDEDSGQVIQGGGRIPIKKNLSVTAGFTALSNVNYWEMAADWEHAFNAGPIDGVMTSRLSYLYGTEGSRGNMQQLNYNDGFSLSFYRTDMTAPDCSDTADKRYSYSGCYKSTSAMLSVPLAEVYGSVGYSQSLNEGRYITRRELASDDPHFAGGVPWDQVWTTRSSSRTWQIGLSRYFNGDGFTVSTSLNAFVRRDSAYEKDDKGGFMSVSLSMASSRLGSDVRSSGSLGASYQSSSRGSNQLSYNAAYSRYADNSGENELGTSLNGIDSQTLNASAWGRVGGQYGSGSLNLNDAYDNHKNQHTFSSSGNYSSSLAVAREGIFWGRWGDGTASSAITVGVAAAENDTTSAVNVTLNTGGQADVDGNSHALFTVPGYREATFNIMESSEARVGAGSEISRGAGSRTVFMPPGRIFNRNVKVSSRYTWLGEMIDNQNRPLEGGIPLNVLSWSPLGNGGFTLETDRLVDKFYVMRDNEFWQCEMKVKTVRDVVRYVGSTQCTNTEMVRLPDAEQKQVSLMTAGNVRDKAPMARVTQ
ncbi:TcfC E-set like domain-containing protein [Serratia liquefaciens]|uniref:TcfC E-set like domain-containing protein n=1 Tax=Serratia liquefaciens TaxID=614 RepID=UPI0023617F95|nr:TcfC E-set like domain-containing protein [Serratia liquefaciens]